MDLGSAEARYAICVACPHFTALLFCSKCGCFMPGKVKLPATKCPIGKW